MAYNGIHVHCMYMDNLHISYNVIVKSSVIVDSKSFNSYCLKVPGIVFGNARNAMNLCAWHCTCGHMV